MNRISHITPAVFVLLAMLTACSKRDTVVNVADDDPQMLAAITKARDTNPQVSAAVMKDEFVREPGQYSLDDEGGTLTITKQPSGTWALQVTWRFGDAASSVAPDDCLLADGWFAFVEEANRIWIFDGVDGGTLLTHSEKEVHVSSFSRENMASCPQTFWDALPQEVRAKYRKVEPDSPNDGPATSVDNSDASGGGRHR